MVLVEKCLKSSFFNLEALRHFPQHSDNLGLTSGISAKYRLLTYDVWGGGIILLDQSQSQIPLMHIKFSGQIPLSKVKYHSQEWNTTPRAKYHSQSQLPPLTRGVFEKSQLPLIGVKYHSLSQIPLPGPNTPLDERVIWEISNTTPMVKYYS